jgi:hypothetical protein
MEYRLIQDHEGGAIYGIKEDGLATGPLRDNEFRDADRPDAAIRIAWAAALDYTDHRPDLWDDDRYVVLATDRDPLSAVTDQPQSLDPREPQ